MSPILQFLRNWTLPVAMVAGVAEYFIAAHTPMLVVHRAFVLDIIAVVQPLLIFTMLFITFCKINMKELRWQRWHGYLLLMQSAAFILLALLLHFAHLGQSGVIAEAAMLCLICPTATAAVVVTAKLGGDTASLTAYTILINLTAALLVPAFVPLVHAQPQGFVASFFLIMGKVFPLLICPLLVALAVKKCLPRVHAFVASRSNLSFYIWAFSLSLAIAVTVRSIVHTDVGILYQLGIAAASLVCCIFQFAVGRLVGRRYGSPISVAQSLGQKNTVFAIWMGYTFLTPISALAGGFYSIWHNVYNSWQLNRMRKKQEALLESTPKH